MVNTNSYELYYQVCQNCGSYTLNIPTGQRYGAYGNNIALNLDDYLESCYIQIINLMFYELFTCKKSSLLNYLCGVNNIYIDSENFEINRKTYQLKITYDIMPILEGLNAVFIGNFAVCKNIYMCNKKNMFKGYGFAQGDDYGSAIALQLVKLDKNIGQVVLNFSNNKKEIIRTEDKSKETGIKIMVPIVRGQDPKLTDKLNKYAEERRTNDLALSEQIQQLQVTLQDELKQIMGIRDGIDYNITQEAINQFIELYNLTDETLQYHPNDMEKNSYHNLVESCEDFSEHIKQSLAMLGVTIINDVGKPFNPEKHKVVRGGQPRRSATIMKVTKIGFLYKNKIIKKAEVEISEDKV